MLTHPFSVTVCIKKRSLMLTLRKSNWRLSFASSASSNICLEETNSSGTKLPTDREERMKEKKADKRFKQQTHFERTQ